MFIWLSDFGMCFCYISPIDFTRIIQDCVSTGEQMRFALAHEKQPYEYDKKLTLRRYELQHNKNTDYSWLYQIALIKHWKKYILPLMIKFISRTCAVLLVSDSYCKKSVRDIKLIDEQYGYGYDEWAGGSFKCIFLNGLFYIFVNWGRCWCQKYA